MTYVDVINRMADDLVRQARERAQTEGTLIRLPEPLDEEFTRPEPPTAEFVAVELIDTDPVSLHEPELRDDQRYNDMLQLCNHFYRWANAHGIPFTWMPTSFQYVQRGWVIVSPRKVQLKWYGCSGDHDRSGHLDQGDYDEHGHFHSRFRVVQAVVVNSKGDVNIQDTKYTTPDDVIRGIAQYAAATGIAFH